MNGGPMKYFSICLFILAISPHSAFATAKKVVRGLASQQSSFVKEGRITKGPAGYGFMYVSGTHEVLTSTPQNADALIGKLISAELKDLSEKDGEYRLAIQSYKIISSRNLKALKTMVGILKRDQESIFLVPIDCSKAYCPMTMISDLRLQIQGVFPFEESLFLDKQVKIYFTKGSSGSVFVWDIEQI